MITTEEKYIRRCIELAQSGAGAVSPNPMVGAVIVYHDRIIGEGFHKKYGEAHAEVNAVNDVLARHADAERILKESTLYVSLEPCAHHGKTPPCTDLIIRFGIPRVVIGSPDPFEQVNGKGVEKLREAGVEVLENVLREDCDFLNRRFFTRIKRHRPYILLKWAQTADGFFAPNTPSQRWISSGIARMLTHRWRSEEDAVLIGKKTALIDNPQLNVREWHGRNPKRIVIDRNLDLPPHLHLFDQTQETLVFNSQKTETVGSVKYLWLENFDHYLPQMIAYQLYLMDIQSVIIEGGVKTLNMFLEANLWDEARVFTSPHYWGEGLKAPSLKEPPAEVTFAGPDKLEVFLAESGKGESEKVKAKR